MPDTCPASFKCHEHVYKLVFMHCNHVTKINKEVYFPTLQSDFKNKFRIVQDVFSRTLLVLVVMNKSWQPVMLPLWEVWTWIIMRNSWSHMYFARDSVCVYTYMYFSNYGVSVYGEFCPTSVPWNVLWWTWSREKLVFCKCNLSQDQKPIRCQEIVFSTLNGNDKNDCLYMLFLY